MAGTGALRFGELLATQLAGRRVVGELLTHRGDLEDRLLTLRTAAGELVEVRASACRPVAGLPERDAAGARRERPPADEYAERAVR